MQQTQEVIGQEWGDLPTLELGHDNKLNSNISLFKASEALIERQRIP
jgi:hypothetical protein